MASATRSIMAEPPWPSSTTTSRVDGHTRCSCQAVYSGELTS